MCSELYFTVNHRLSSTWKVSNCFKTDYKTAFHLIMSEDLPLWVSCLEVMCHIWLLPRLGSNSSAASERKCVWESGWQRHFKEVQDVSNHLSAALAFPHTLCGCTHSLHTEVNTLRLYCESPVIIFVNVIWLSFNDGNPDFKPVRSWLNDYFRSNIDCRHF